MTDRDDARKLDQLAHLLTAPDAPMKPSLVWALLAEISQHDAAASQPGPGGSAD